MYAQTITAPDYMPYVQKQSNYSLSQIVSCDWQQLREQLLMQWKRIAGWELDAVGPNRSRIAQLIERKYGIASQLTENYLRNFERTMPLAGNA